MGKELGRNSSPNMQSHLKRKRGHNLNRLNSLSDNNGDSASNLKSLETISDAPSVTVIDEATDLETFNPTLKWDDSQSPTPSTTMSPTNNFLPQSRHGNSSFTIFFLFIIVFCMFTSSPSVFKRFSPRHRRRRRRAREAAIAAEEAAIAALVENALAQTSISENRALHGMTVSERMNLIKNVVKIEKVISLPMSRTSSESSITSFTDQSKQPSQTAILGGEPQDQVKLMSSNTVSPSQPLSSELSPPEQYKHPSSTEENNDNDSNISILEKNGIPNSDTCAICLLEYEKGDEICWSHHKKCFHAFHFDCMTEWLLRHNECPCCRNDYLNIGGSSDDDNIENVYIDNIENRQQRENNDLDGYTHGMQVFYGRISHLVRIHSSLRTIDEDHDNNNRHSSQSNSAEPLVSSSLREPNVTTTSDNNNQNELTTEVNEMNDADSSNDMVSVEIDRISNSSQNNNSEPLESSALIGTNVTTTSDDNNQNELTTEANEMNDTDVLNDMVSVEIDRISNIARSNNSEPLASSALTESNVTATSDDNSHNELTTEVNEMNDADGLNNMVSVEIDRIGTSTIDCNEESSTEGNIDNNSDINERSEHKLENSEDLDSNHGDKETVAGSVEMNADVTIDMDSHLNSSADNYEPNNLPAGIFRRASQTSQETVIHEKVITSSVNEDDSEVTNVLSVLSTVVTMEQSFSETNPISTMSDKMEHEGDGNELGVLKRSEMDDFNPKASITHEHLKCPIDAIQYDEVTISSRDVSKEKDDGNYVLANDSSDPLKEDGIPMSTYDIRREMIIDRDYMTQINPTPIHFENVVSKGNKTGAHSIGEEKGPLQSVIVNNTMQEKKGYVLESPQDFQNESSCISDSIHARKLSGEEVISSPSDSVE